VGGGVCKRRRGRRLVAAHRRTSSARRRLMGRRDEVGLLMASRGEDRSVDKCWLIDCSLCSIQCCCIHVKYCICCLAELHHARGEDEDEKRRGWQLMSFVWFRQRMWVSEWRRSRGCEMNGIKFTMCN
jgi:hypothetical protein